MFPSKAIELLKLDLQDKGERKEPDLRKAQRMGIQALQRIIDCRQVKDGISVWDDLDGEGEHPARRVKDIKHLGILSE
jgi:hypothetical protein